MDTHTSIDFFDYLSKSKEFKEFADILTNLIGLRAALYDKEHKRTRGLHDPKKGNPLCDLIRAKEEGLNRCNACDWEHCNLAIRSGQPLRYICHAGFIDMSIPIYVDGKHISSIMCGQFLPEPPSEKGLREFCRRNSCYGFTPSKVRKAYYQAPYISSEQIDLVLKLFSFFVHHLCENLQRIQNLSLAQERKEISAAREYVVAHFHENITLADISKHIHMSPAYFSHLFHKLSGTNLTKYIQKTRMEAVKRKLESSTDSITQIAFDCGFNNLTHFNRVFQSHEKCTPSRYRKDHLINDPNTVKHTS